MSACWVKRPTCAPFIRLTVPVSGCMPPAISFISVDLPEPFTPTRPMRAPSLRVRFTPERMQFMPKDLLTS